MDYKAPNLTKIKSVKVKIKTLLQWEIKTIMLFRTITMMNLQDKTEIIIYIFSININMDMISVWLTK